LSDHVNTIELSAGTIRYLDTGGHGPVIVFVHGLLMDGSLWRRVVAELQDEFRCIRPTLPLGGHPIPMRPDADLSMRGIARLLAEFLERLDLRDVSAPGKPGATCSPPASIYQLSPGRHSSPGRARTGSCRQSTVVASPPYCQTRGTSKSRTATR
jgi:hypothetical protein